MRSGTLSLAHGWKLIREAETPAALIRDFVRPAVRAVPGSLAQRVGPCRISLPAALDGDAASRWTAAGDVLEVSVATAGVEQHDVAMELLVCLGQAVWEKLSDDEFHNYWTLLREEIGAGIKGEIDEQALEAKRSLFASEVHAGNRRRLTRYGLASFAGTAAEYIHCLWHDVTVRTGSDHLPAPALRRRLELLASWFPPDPGHHLFPTERG